MDDPVLTSRIEALQNNLKVVATNLESGVWQMQHDPQNERAELMGESLLWVGLNTHLVRELNRHARALEGAAKQLADAPSGDTATVAKAWDAYGKTLRESKDLLRECLEIIGTLAIRTRNLDNRILYVADELIRDCMTLSTGDLQYYLHVHGMGDTFSKTRGRIIRLRFPDWTIWDLPLAAHELGRVVVAEIVDEEKREEEAELHFLTTFADEQRKALLAIDPDLAAAAPADLDRWAQTRVRILLADAFATYTMGPAYACSAIILRLSPGIGAERDQPSDVQRAHVILSVLRVMNEKVRVSPPYGGVIAKLEQAWKDTVDRSRPGAAPLSQEYAAYLDELAKTFVDKIADQILNRTAEYPFRAGGDGWQKAREWAEAWTDQWTRRQPLEAPTDLGGKLRDVLNATWLCRLEMHGSPGEMSRAHSDFATAAHNLCKNIIAARSAGGGARRIR